MYILFFNIIWMIWNILLAFLGVWFSWALNKVESRFAKILLFFPWLLIVPNTIYIVTDSIHLRWELPEVSGIRLMLVIIQFAIFIPLGAVTYYVSMRFFEQGVRRLWEELTLKKINFNLFIVLINFAIAYAVAMGRFARTNSWEVISDPWRVVRDIFAILTSPNTIVFVLIFGVFANILYFEIRRLFHK